MKIFTHCAKFAVVLTLVALFASCTGNEKATNSLNSDGGQSNGGAMLNIRYIDQDSLLRNYNLAKELSEVSIRNADKLQQEYKKRETEIQRFAATIQNKMQTNGYLSEASYRADEQKLQDMQNKAQNYMAVLQRDVQNEELQNNIQLNDSVDNFLKKYSKEKGYEVVFNKAAAFYIDPKYDITADVIKGLNASYTKVEAGK